MPKLAKHMLNNLICSTRHFLPTRNQRLGNGADGITCSGDGDAVTLDKVDVNWAVLFVELVLENDCDR
jgi:hypothetical protein